MKAIKIFVAVLVLSFMWGAEEYYFRVVLPPQTAHASIKQLNGGDQQFADLQTIEMEKNWIVVACSTITILIVVSLFGSDVCKLVKLCNQEIQK